MQYKFFLRKMTPVAVVTRPRNIKKVKKEGDFDGLSFIISDIYSISFSLVLVKI